jgi:hypothetical protein
MASKEEFRKFVSNKPSLADYVENGSMTWQKFYEMFDLYGEDSSVWDKYLNRKNTEESSFNKINDIIKNVDINSIKEHISTAQKALDFVQELTSKDTAGKVAKAISTPRPINKFFED